MGHSYEQLGLDERIEIYRLHREGRSQRAIAAQLKRSPATISRELRRNSRPTHVWPGGYDALRAQGLAERRRRWDGRYKLARQPDLQAEVRQCLAMGQSPEQIAGRLALKHDKRTIISHEAIYRFIYHRSQQKDYWHRLLPKRKSRRGRLGKRGGSPASFIERRQPISERPADALSGAGHWEADLMAFSRYGHYLVLAQERSTRLLLLRRQSGRDAETTAKSLHAQFRRIPKRLRQTVTFDNGTEFAHHYELTDRLHLQTFFCDPHSPWQKGGIENAIGRLRRYLPRRTDLESLSSAELLACVRRYNHTPRKCLGFRTPAEAFSDLRNVALQT